MATAAVQSTVIILPAIALGLILGLYEALVIHRDVTIPSRRLGHMTHALILSIIFVFVNMNVPFIYAIFPALASIKLLNQPLLFQIAVGLIAAIKIHGVSAALKSKGASTAGMSETWFHSILIGGLIVAIPYIYPFIAPLMPVWLK